MHNATHPHRSVSFLYCVLCMYNVHYNYIMYKDCLRFYHNYSSLWLMPQVCFNKLATIRL